MNKKEDRGIGTGKSRALIYYKLKKALRLDLQENQLI